MMTTTNPLEEAIAVWQAAHGTSDIPDVPTVVTWLMNRARDAETALLRVNEVSVAITAMTNDLAIAVEDGIRSVQQGFPLPAPRGSQIKFSGWTLDTRVRSLKAPNGLDIGLTTAEFEIMKILLSSPNMVMTRETIAELALGRQLGEDDRTVDIHIVRLRRKLEMDPKHPVLIKTIYGQGYLFTQGAAPSFSRGDAPTVPPELVRAVQDEYPAGWVLEVNDVRNSDGEA